MIGASTGHWLTVRVTGTKKWRRTVFPQERLSSLPENATEHVVGVALLLGMNLNQRTAYSVRAYSLTWYLKNNLEEKERNENRLAAYLFELVLLIVVASISLLTRPGASWGTEREGVAVRVCQHLALCVSCERACLLVWSSSPLPSTVSPGEAFGKRQQ